jgi:hypothetical protein
LSTIASSPPSCYDLVDLGGPSLASLMLVVAHDPFCCDSHVDRCFPFPFSWL